MDETRPTPPVTRVSATAAAIDLIDTLRKQHGQLMFFQSGGCCDGSAPMCYPLGDFKLGAGDVRLGEIDGVPFYMGRAQFEYWEHTHIIIDVVPGRGGAFSLDSVTGLRFISRSRLYTDEEWAYLQQHPDDAEVLFYQGICYLETGHTSDAKQNFRQLYDADPLLKNAAAWYLGLTFVKEQTYDSTRFYLDQLAPTSEYAAPSRKLLKALK